MSAYPVPPGGRSFSLNRRQVIALGAAASGAAVLSSLNVLPAAADSRTPEGRRTTRRSLGVNATGYDAGMLDPAIPGLLRQAHIGQVRYPGGGNADGFDWRTGGPFTWPDFMSLMDSTGGAPLITVNYGQTALGPEVAGDWVASARTYPNYDSGTALWVIGNEGYGPWELDQHADPHTPASYAANARPYFQAVHAADPNAQTGFPMSIDRNVSGGTGTWVADPDLWNRTVLSRNVDQVDFIDFHWYPVFGIPVLTNAQIFETVRRIPDAMRYLRGVIEDCGSTAYLVCGESNISQSEVVYNAQPVAALYAAAASLTFLANGAVSYLWWQVHNTDNMNGDFGFLSDGTGSPGPSATTTTGAAGAGQRHIEVADTTGFYYGHRFTVGTGARQESHKITAIGGTAALAADAGPRSANLTVDTVVPFAPGTPVTIGSGADQEICTVTHVGTGADSGALAAPAAPGDRVLRIVGTGMGGQSIPVFMPIGFAAGGSVTVGTGHSAETAVIASVGTSSSLGTTTAAPSAAGDRTLYVVSVANSDIGIANYVGDPITVDGGTAEEVRVITAVGSSAAAATSTSAAVAAGDRRVRLASVAGVVTGHPLLIGGEIVHGVSTVSDDGWVALSAPVRSVHPAGAPARDLGTGITLSAPLTHAHPAGTATRDAGGGLTLTAPLRRAHGTGSAIATAGTGITVSPAPRRTHPTGTAVTSTGITLTPALRAAHPAGTAVAELGLKEPAKDTPMPAYWGYVMASLLTKDGAYLTEVASPSPAVLAYSSFAPGETQSVMLINTDDEHDTHVAVHGLPGKGTVRTYAYGLENPSVVESTSTVPAIERGLTLPPESITVLVSAAGDIQPQVRISGL